MTPIEYGSVEEVLETLTGAEIEECKVGESDGLHVCLRDGRTLVVVCTGYIGIHIYGADERTLQ